MSSFSLIKYFHLFFLLSYGLVSCTPDREQVREQLSKTTFQYDTIEGIGYEEGITRRDPSNVIKVGDTWYVWYTKVYGRAPGYWGTLWYATSTDKGFTWHEQGEALGVGPKGAFDSHAVFTPNILPVEGKYYLFYTGVKPTPGREDNKFENNAKNDYTAIGVAVADAPEGPFTRIDNKPVLMVSKDPQKFDSYRVDDADLIFRDGKYWLYYKGRSLSDGKSGPRKTKMGVAFSKKPAGPYKKYEGNPVLDKSHEVMVWPQGKGVACLASISSTFEYAPDGLDFLSDPLEVKIPEEQLPRAPGAFRPDLTNPKTTSINLQWGISMEQKGNSPYLVRYQCVQ